MPAVGGSNVSSVRTEANRGSGFDRQRSTERTTLRRASREEMRRPFQSNRPKGLGRVEVRG
jgi:hypothetical protein